MNFVLSAAEFVLMASACVIDVRTRRIPNSLTLGAALLAIGNGFVVDGLGGVGSACGWGFAAAFVPAVVYLIRPDGFGGGDVKLCFALGAICGAAGPIAVAVGCGLGVAWCIAKCAFVGVSGASESIALAPFLVAGAIAASLAG
jgi:leader peptidase (prepilin peptidase)/N-methyltransferase